MTKTTAKTPETPTSEESSGAQAARQEKDVVRADELMAAIDVLEIYSDGKGDAWKRVRKKYPQFVNSGRAAPGMPFQKFTNDNVVTWAAGVVAGEPIKQAMAARVFRELGAIAFGDKSTPTMRLNALRLLGRECGMFTARNKKSGGLPFREIRRIIVDPKATDDEPVASECKDE